MLQNIITKANFLDYQQYTKQRLVKARCHGAQTLTLTLYVVQSNDSIWYADVTGILLSNYVM